MGGVDLSDMKASLYKTNRKSIKFWVCIFYDCLMQPHSLDRCEWEEESDNWLHSDPHRAGFQRGRNLCPSLYNQSMCYSQVLLSSASTNWPEPVWQQDKTLMLILQQCPKRHTQPSGCVKVSGLN